MSVTGAVVACLSCFVVSGVSSQMSFSGVFLSVRRAYCSRRLNRVRKSVKFTHGKGKFTKKTLDAAHVKDPRCTSSTSTAALLSHPTLNVLLNQVPSLTTVQCRTIVELCHGAEAGFPRCDVCLSTSMSWAYAVASLLRLTWKSARGDPGSTR